MCGHQEKWVLKETSQMMFASNNRLGAISFTNTVMSSNMIKTNQPRDHIIRMERHKEPWFCVSCFMSEAVFPANSLLESSV